jgi:endonuclease/exonuclease/phosphatase family metal-dependent hydrolase
LAALSLLVRTWNVFHGRTVPPSGRTYLERMIRLVTADGPHVVALQEVPVFALGRLERWSGMAALGAVARPARLGRLGRRLTELAPDVFRSLFNGQANALLVRPDLTLAGEQTIVVLNPGALRERRVCQCLRLHAGERTILVANFHATAHVPELARAELERVARVVAGGEPVIVCGDFNLPRTGLPGFSVPIGGVDQIVVRGLEFERPPARWPRDRRRFEGHFLSDHAPVEAVVA